MSLSVKWGEGDLKRCYNKKRDSVCPSVLHRPTGLLLICIEIEINIFCNINSLINMPDTYTYICVAGLEAYKYKMEVMFRRQ